jgi:hypothetical protein|tara:strand:+ start:283 stop:498 length:216 start_codon:yes stop_codon:yes gene_type:complete
MSEKSLTTEEVIKAADTFFPLYDVIHTRMPEGSTTEDALKVMETVCKLAHKLREEKETEAFGFLKSKDKEE